MAPITRQDTGTTLGLLTGRVEDLRCDISELKGIMRDMADSERQRHEKLVAVDISTKRAHERIDEINTWKSDVNKVFPMMKAVMWLITALSVPVIIWLVNVLWQWLLYQVR